VLDATANAVA